MCVCVCVCVCVFVHAENFLEDGSSSSEQPGNPSPRTGSVGREGKLGVAFDPAAGGAAHDEGGKVHAHVASNAHMYVCVFYVGIKLF